MKHVPRRNKLTSSSSLATLQSIDQHETAERFSPDEELMNEHAAAAFLDLSVQTLRAWRWQKRGPPFYRLPGSTAIRYGRSHLRDYRDAGLQAPLPAA